MPRTISSASCSCTSCRLTYRARDSRLTLCICSPASYKQSLWAAQHAYKLFKRASVPFTRPNDYYAEMLKTDEHMEKIRQKLLDEQAGIKASDNAKRQRELKKFGKQVQVNKLREREKSKRDLDDKVKAFKKSGLPSC